MRRQPGLLHLEAGGALHHMAATLVNTLQMTNRMFRAWRHVQVADDHPKWEEIFKAQTARSDTVPRRIGLGTDSTYTTILGTDLKPSVLREDTSASAKDRFKAFWRDRVCLGCLEAVLGKGIVRSRCQEAWDMYSAKEHEQVRKVLAWEGAGLPPPPLPQPTHRVRLRPVLTSPDAKACAMQSRRFFLYNGINQALFCSPYRAFPIHKQSSGCCASRTSTPLRCLYIPPTITWTLAAGRSPPLLI